jgi:hypothetical protein
VGRHGTTLAIRTAGANASDDTQIIPRMLDFLAVGGRPRRRKEMLDELHAHNRYDSAALRWLMTWLGTMPHNALRLAGLGSGLGKVRWVVEQTISSLRGLVQMRLRSDPCPRSTRRGTRWLPA